ncbi:MAG: hypothetical protein Edafosvirus40_5 [Edafosvirus sp.]|uniref:Uncharacterized protein n=1 Tax=Edafosvirus sp. TaxID=2487765 RepID=A0A3G4ZVF2_9VIRU|nr:MAG: hypothetical protein Edafosvirus40_5 [Edafosvirus sp.]
MAGKPITMYSTGSDIAERISDEICAMYLQKLINKLNTLHETYDITDPVESKYNPMYTAKMKLKDKLFNNPGLFPEYKLDVLYKLEWVSETELLSTYFPSITPFVRKAKQTLINYLNYLDELKINIIFNKRVQNIF